MLATNTSCQLINVWWYTPVPDINQQLPACHQRVGKFSLCNKGSGSRSRGKVVVDHPFSPSYTCKQLSTCTHRITDDCRRILFSPPSPTLLIATNIPNSQCSGIRQPPKHPTAESIIHPPQRHYKPGPIAKECRAGDLDASCFLELFCHVTTYTHISG